MCMHRAREIQIYNNHNDKNNITARDEPRPRNKGYIVTKRELPMKPSYRKGSKCVRNTLIREARRE